MSEKPQSVREIACRAVALAVVLVTVGCGERAPVAVAPSKQPAQASSIPGLGSFAVYKMLAADPFPSLPSGENGWLDSSRRFGWVLRVLNDGTKSHYVTLDGEVTDAPRTLFERSSAPEPTLPPGAQLLFHGRSIELEGEAATWRYASVAVEGKPLVTGADVAHCTIESNPSLNVDSHGQATRQDRPWLRVELKASGLRKLAAISPDIPLIATLGDVALTEYWTADTMATFPVDGISDETRSRRAEAMRAVCSRP